MKTDMDRMLQATLQTIHGLPGADFSLDVACPRCKSPAGIPCRSYWGRAKPSHQARRMLREQTRRVP